MSQNRDDNRNGPDGALIDLADAAARRGRKPSGRAPHVSLDQSGVPSSAGTELLAGFPDLEPVPDPLTNLAVDDILDRALAQPPSTPGHADREIEDGSGDDQPTSIAGSELDEVHRRLTHHHERPPGDLGHRAARGSADLAPGLAQAPPRRHRSKSATKPSRSRRAIRTRPLALCGLVVGLVVIGVVAHSAFDNGSARPSAVRTAQTAAASATALSATAATVVSITAQPRSHYAGAQPSSRRSHPTRRIHRSHRSQRHITTAYAWTRAAQAPAHNPAVAVTAPVQPTTSTPAPASSPTQTHSTQSAPSFGYQGLLGAGYGNGTG